MNINISGEVVRTSQLPKRIIGLGDYLVALNSSPLETSTVLVSDFVSFLNTQFATSLASLTDVSINTPLIGQALVYNGSQWVNQGIGELDTLDSVTTRGNTTTNSITVGGLYSPYLRLDTVATPTLQAGMFAWNDAFGTADLRLKGNNVTLQIGQEILARVVNKTGADLLESDYKVVRVRIASEGGAQGQRLAVVLAQGNNDPDSVTTLGIVTEDISNNQEGFITILGNVNNINTTGTLQGETWVDGDVLYLSPTTPGGLTKVKPQAPQHTLIVGYVVYAHQNNGKIFVKVDNGYELDELHNVLISNPNNNDILQYNSTQQVWKNIAASVAVPTPTLAQVTTAGNTTTNAITVGDVTINGTTLTLNSTAAHYTTFVSSATALDIQSFNNTPIRINNGGGGAVFIGGASAWISSAILNFGTGTSDGLVIRGGSASNGKTIQSYGGHPLILNSIGNNVLIGTTTDSGYKLDVNGTARVRNTLRVVGSVGYGANVFEFGVNGGTGQNGYIDGFGRWFISNGGTNTTSAFVGGDILRFGQGSESKAISFSNTNNVIGQWSGTVGTFNNTTTSETIILVNNAATANLYGITIAGDQTAGQLNSKNLLTLSHWGSSGVQTFGSTSAAQFYNLINVNIAVSPTQTNKTLRGFYYNPTISGTALSVHRAIETTSGDVVFNGGNVGIRTSSPTNPLDIAFTSGRLISFRAAPGYADFGQIVFSNVTGADIISSGTIGFGPGDTNKTVVLGNGLTSKITTPGSTKYDGFGNQAPSTLAGSTNRPVLFTSTIPDGNIDGFIFENTSSGSRNLLKIIQNNTTLFTLNPNGNVLIGTTTDAGYKLDVLGNTRVQVSSAGVPNILHISNLQTDAGPGGAIAFYTGGGISNASRIVAVRSGTSGQSDIGLETTGVTRLFVAANSGNVGIGTTSPFGKLDVKDGEIFVTTSTNANLRSRLTYQGLSVSRASDGGYPEQIISTDSAWQYHSRNRHTLYIDTIPHLQIGNVGISGLNIPQSNNIIIGNSADNGYKLQVNGNAFIKGSGSTSATSSLLIQNSSGTQLFRITDDGTINTSYSAPINCNFALTVMYDITCRGVFGNSGPLQMRGASAGNGTGSMVDVLYYGSPASGSIGTSLKISSAPLQSGVHIGLNFNGDYTSSVGSNTLIGYNFAPTNYSTATLRAFQSAVGGVYVNTTSYQASAILQADSTTQGFLPPRLTTAQILAITSPAEGLQVYNTDLKTICFYNGTAWQRVTSTAM